MALDMTAEERELGQKNFARVSDDLSRRGFLKSLGAAFAAGGAGAATYFGYQAFSGDPVKAALIGCGDEGGVLAGEHDPKFVQIVAVSDIRPYNQDRIFAGQGANHIRKGLEYHYGNDARNSIKVYEDYKQLLRDEKEIDMVIVALPLHLHAPASIDAMKAGQERGRPIHVLCEKLMARTIGQCKEMIRIARETGSLLAVGHQRHYSLLYSHALEVINSGVLGDVRHIRALWHRNNTWPFEPKASPAEVTKDGLRQPYYRDGWFQPIYEMDYAALNDPALLEKYGYRNIDELIRWRLYDRTGGGLMAELGSHQLDACSIFLGKVRPVAVSGVGVKSFYGPGRNDRSCDDHVFTTFEFPGANYYKDVPNPDPTNKDHINDADDVVVMTYSSVNTNGFENYGECLMGSRGTMIVEAEQAVMLYSEPAPGGGGPPRATNVTVSTVGANTAALEAAASGYAPPSGAVATATTGGPVSRGYTEEMAHFAYCIKLLDGGKATYEKDSEGKFRQEMPRCHGEVAMADAVLALTSNISMDKRERITFENSWFEWDADGVPDADVNPDAIPEKFQV